MKYRGDFEKFFRMHHQNEFQSDPPPDTFKTDPTGNWYFRDDIRLAYKTFVSTLDQYAPGISKAELMDLYQRRQIKERLGLDFHTFLQCPLEVIILLLGYPQQQSLTGSVAPVLDSLSGVLGSIFTNNDWMAQAQAAGMTRPENHDGTGKSSG